MNQSAFSQVQDLLDRNETVGIVVGRNPNVDEMGAALALYLALQTIGKKVSVASATEPLVEVSSLVGIDKVKDTFEAEGGDLVVSFPYREGEIDKVSYTLEDGALNIVVKPGELGLSFTERDVVFRRKGDYPALIFTIGAPRLSDLSPVFDVNSVKGTAIVNIDNKVDNEGFGDVAIISPESSSVSEMVAKILSSLGYDMDLDVAQNLLSGILDATDNFASPNTSPLSFEMAGILMQKGAVRQLVRRQHEQRQVPQDQGRILQELSRMREQQNQQKRFEQRRGQQREQRPVQQQQGQQQTQQNPSINPGQGQQNNQQQQNQKQDLKNPPEEWLTPKVYKGSTSV